MAVMKKALLQTNPWLRDPNQRAALLRISAASSSAVEGIFSPFRDDVPEEVKSPRPKTSKSLPGRG
jgi:hypothetical protein